MVSAAAATTTTVKTTTAVQSNTSTSDVEQKGKLVCDGKEVDSEVIYWKIVPGDIDYESPITPHHGDHHDKYLSFEYDQGGWNNVRMSLECLIVVAHAMGRTLVVPPQQHLYLLGRTHKDKHDKQAHDEMGFEDFFDIDLLRSHRGYHVLHMEEFLQKEGVTGGLRGQLPPGNTSKAWGDKLWKYLKKVADETPAWQGHFVVFPDHPGNFTRLELMGPHAKRRMQAFSGGRQPVFYDDKLQKAHHIHFPADGEHRILQHHYGMYLRICIRTIRVLNSNQLPYT
jgi:GDP-fucose protein O-fucosyltransferase